MIDRLMSQSGPQALLLAAGRICLAAIYLGSGLRKIGRYSGVVDQLAAKGLPLPEVAALSAIAVEAGAAAALIVGLWTRWAALALAGFTILATLMFHNFWDFEGPDRARQYVQFMKNLGLVGGFLVVMATGAGRLSVDALLSRRRGASRPDDAGK